MKKEQELAARGVEVQDEELRQFVRGMEEAADTEAVDSELVWTGVELGIADVLKSDADHRHALAELFSVAVTYVALAYPVLTPEMSYLVPLLGTALDKGLLVNMLFGEMPKKENPDSWRVFESLKKLEYDSARGQSSGRLVLGNHPTECCTSIALADSPSEVMAIVDRKSVV